MSPELMKAIKAKMPTYCGGLNTIGLMIIPETIEDPTPVPKFPAITVKLDCHGLNIYGEQDCFKPFPDIG